MLNTTRLPATELDTAILFLRNQLADGTRRLSDVLAEWPTQRLDIDWLEAARKTLGITPLWDDTDGICWWGWECV